MNKNLILKIMLLLFGLVVIIWFRQQMGSKNTMQTLNSIFGVEPKKNQFNWCADHVVDFSWIETDLPTELKSLDMSDLRENFCSFEVEPIIDVNMDQVTWTSLAESAGAAGQKTTLLWNRNLKLFKSGGLPFKSSKFTEKLLQSP